MNKLEEKLIELGFKKKDELHWVKEYDWFRVEAQLEEDEEDETTVLYDVLTTMTHAEVGLANDLLSDLDNLQNDLNELWEYL